MRIPWGGRSRRGGRWGRGAVILEGSGSEITICGRWAGGGDWGGRAQRGPGTVIRSLPQRTGGCLESHRVAGWPLTACSSSGTRELWGIGEDLVVNIKCDILPFAYREKRKGTEGIMIWGENGDHLFPVEMISSFLAFNFSSLNCSWNLPHKTAFKSFETCIHCMETAYSLHPQRGLIVASMGWMVNEAI